MSRTFKISFLLLVAFLTANLSVATAAEPDTRVYELRIYTAAEGKWDKLLNRFKEHTVRLFEKHGMTNVGYWQPLEGDEPKLYYILSFKDAATREQAWKDFLADEDWKAAYKASESDGKLASKMESHVLTATDFSPALDIADKSPRVFELRTYTATPGNLPNLLARFRDHTVKLFEKHGMTNIGYWVPVKGAADADTTLIYLLAHKDRDAAKASFAAFGKDPEWQEARKASEVKGGGSLTTKGGVQSLFLKPVEFSKLK
jgi:hypothetical protein